MKTRNAGCLVMALFLISHLTGCSQKAGKEKIFSFLDNFNAGTISPSEEPGSPTGKPAFIMGEFEVGGEKRRAMITMASAKITFSAETGADPMLKFSVGMNATRGDGAEGIITIEADGKSDVVYKRYLNPAELAADRHWFEGSADLSAFAGKRVAITFETKAGPNGDAIADWFAWSNIELTGKY